jgi:hypothetical protein
MRADIIRLSPHSKPGDIASVGVEWSTSLDGASNGVTRYVLYMTYFFPGMRIQSKTIAFTRPPQVWGN